jgi:hypothetical protein
MIYFNNKISFFFLFAKVFTSFFFIMWEMIGDTEERGRLHPDIGIHISE